MAHDATVTRGLCAWDLLKKASGLGPRTAAIPEGWAARAPTTSRWPSSSRSWASPTRGFATLIRGCYTESPQPRRRRPQRRAARRVAAKFLRTTRSCSAWRAVRAGRGHRLPLPVRRARRVHPDLRRARRRRVRHQRRTTLHLLRRHRQALLPLCAYRQEGPHLHEPELLPGCRPTAPGFPHGRFHNKLAGGRWPTRS